MGCSLSGVGTSIIVPQTISLNHVQAGPIDETIPQSIRFLENCLIIWFSEETSNRFDKGQEQLRELDYRLKTFNNIDACITFISSIQDEKVFLIVSGRCQTIERFQYLSQLEKIYLFVSSSHELNNAKYRNLNYDTIENLDDLSKQLREDIELCEMDLMFITVAPLSTPDISSLSSLAKQEASFLLVQMIKEIMYRTKFDSGSKDVFIDFCRAHYVNSQEQLSVIDDFAKTYRPNKALWWLTKQCFISQILNRALRTHELDIIHKLGFFFKHVNLQLSRLHEENASLMKDISMVYRGKTMSDNEFDLLLKEKSGSLLSFANFLLATTKKEVAFDFVGRRLAVHPDMTGIVFEIHIDHTVYSEKSPFALLKDMDMSKDEICFHMGTVFRIESVEKTINDAMMIWFVKLKLIDNDDQQLRRLVASARSDEMHANPGSYVGKILIDMGEYRRAERTLLELLQDTIVLNQPRSLGRIHNGLGAVYTCKNEHAKALEHYQQSLQTSLIYLKPDHPDLATIYKAIGDTHLNQSDYIHAVENYEKAIELLEYDTQQIHSDLLADLHTCVNTARQLIESNKYF